MQRRTEIEIALFLSNDSKEWDVSIMSRTEHQEMRSQISSLHDWTWKREYDKLLKKKLEHEQRERQLRLQQLLLQQQKELHRIFGAIFLFTNKLTSRHTGETETSDRLLS